METKTPPPRWPKRGPTGKLIRSHATDEKMALWTLLLTITLAAQSHSRPYDLHIENELIISVKSSSKFHKTRLGDVRDTWFPLASAETFVFTDSDDPRTNETFNGHLINTQCGSEHIRSDLCCKMNAELNFFVKKDARWSCHFDDDNYVNVPRLRLLLLSFDHRQDYYLGKMSMRKGIHIDSPENASFHFATGGAGVCLSRSLVRKLAPLVEDDGFQRLGNTVMLPDDVTLGYLIEHVLRVPMTEIPEFHSHLEDLSKIRTEDLHEQVSLSGIGGTSKQQESFINIKSSKKDRLRFRAIHCLLFNKSC